MATNPPAAYCFFQELAPRPTLSAEFDRDYLLYASSGALRLTVGGESWLLPRSFAAWVPAATAISVDIPKPVTACSVLTSPGFCPRLPRRVSVFQTSPMARHMVEYCKDWGPEAPHPPEAEPFFLTLLNVCADLLPKSVDVKRPTATHPAVRRAIELMERRLAESLTAADVAQIVGLSERSMQRHFPEDVGMTWSEALTRLRMIHAVALLADGDQSILEIAGDVGFNSLSAFNRAFRKFAGKTPTEFRQAVSGR